MDYTFSLPFTNEKFMDGIKRELKRRGDTTLYMYLKDAKVSIDELGTSYYVDHSGRWNAKGVNISFKVNPLALDSLINGEYKRILTKICDDFIPGEVGFDIKDIVYVEDLSRDFENEDIMADLEAQVSNTSNSILKKILPDDILNKGQEMAEAYTYLYSVENSLRLFIELVAKEKHGEEYMTQLTITTSLRNTISGRKEKASQNKWLSIRGDNDLFFLDFKDLGAVISNNWALYKPYFNSQDFIIPKLNEMAECRNLIAHNSYISKIERDLLKSYYNSITMQISEKFTNEDEEWY